MATSANPGATAKRPAPPMESDRKDSAPNAASIMAGIRRTVQTRPNEPGPREKDLRDELQGRMLRPFSTRGFSETFTADVRSRVQGRWNIQLSADDLADGESAAWRVARAVFSPVLLLAFNLGALVGMASRQAEINEYHRRLLWATNRDLAIARRELDGLKRELRRLGVHADFSAGGPPSRSRPAGRSGSSARRSGPGRGRGRRGPGRNRGRRSGDRPRGGRGRSGGGR